MNTPQQYEPTYRAFFRERILGGFHWKGPVQISHYLVEGRLASSKTQAVLTLANWSLTTQYVTVQVALPWKPSQPTSAINGLRNVKIRGKNVTFSLNLNEGDFVMFAKA